MKVIRCQFAKLIKAKRMNRADIHIPERRISPGPRDRCNMPPYPKFHLFGRALREGKRDYICLGYAVDCHQPRDAASDHFSFSSAGAGYYEEPSGRCPNCGLLFVVETLKKQLLRVYRFQRRPPNDYSSNSREAWCHYKFVLTKALCLSHWNHGATSETLAGSAGIDRSDNERFPRPIVVE